MGNPAGPKPKTATVLFTDLVASTELRRVHGDALADDLRRRHDEALRTAAAEHLGEVVKGTGDGLMIVFPAAAEAVAGAVAIQRAISRLRRQHPDADVRIRVGMSAGDVVWEDDDCFGTPVVEAARLCDAAEASTILVSEIVRLLAGSRTSHRLEPAGTFELKGLGETAAYVVTWEPDPADRRGDGDGTIPLPQPLVPTETLPLIGREVELDVLTSAYKEAASGRPQIVVVAGEPGVGKTRLAAEAARLAHDAGATVLFGRCDEDLAVPYQPFVEGFTAFAANCDDERLLQLLGSTGGELSRLVPSFEIRFSPQLTRPLRADADTERFRLFEAATNFLHALTADAPAVFVLDDLHWAAQPTLLLLRHLVRARGAEPLLIVATYRDTDLSRTHPLAEVLADLRREHDITRLSVRGLSVEEVTSFVQAAAGHDLDDAARELATQVYAETEGNPFFVGQVLRHLSESGAIRMEGERWTIDRRAATGIPEGVRDVIGKRLTHLSAETNDVLAVAAVIGREFDRSLLAEASGTSFDDVLDALEEAETTRLVAPSAGRDDLLAFTHALVRSTLYDEIPTTRRLRIHRRIADALEVRAGRGVRCVEELAHHSREAAALGDTERAIRWSREAAVAARARLAYEEAVEHLQRAYDVLDPDDRATLEARAEVGAELANAVRIAGSLPASRLIALEAAAAARAAGRIDLVLRAALVIGGERAWSEAGLVDQELIALLEEGLAGGPGSDAPDRAKALARLGSELYFDVPSADRRQALTEEALAMAERLNDDGTTEYVLSCSLWGSWVPGSAPDRRERARELIEIGRRSGDQVSELVGYTWLVTAEAELGDGKAVAEAVASELRLSEELKIAEYEWVAMVHQTCWALTEGRIEEGMAIAERALQTGMAMGTETAMQMYGVALFAQGRVRGGLEELLPLTQSLVDQYPLIPAWRTALGFLYRELGMAEEARAVFEHFAADHFASIPFDANWLVGMGLLAMVPTLAPGLAAAPELYDRLLPFADLMMIAGMPCDVVASVRHPLMLLAASLERWDEADAHYVAAQQKHTAMGARVAEVLTDLEWAQLLRRCDEPGVEERIQELATRAQANAAAIGASRFAHMAAALRG